MLALLRVLRTLFGDRPAILIPLAVYLFCPLALAAVDWWSVAVQTLPLELSIFMAVDAHVRYLRGGRMRTAVAAAGWLLLGMATAQKGAVTPLLLFALTSAFFVRGALALRGGRGGPAVLAGVGAVRRPAGGVLRAVLQQAAVLHHPGRRPGPGRAGASASCPRWWGRRWCRGRWAARGTGP